MKPVSNGAAIIDIPVRSQSRSQFKKSPNRRRSESLVRHYLFAIVTLVLLMGVSPAAFANCLMTWNISNNGSSSYTITSNTNPAIFSSCDPSFDGIYSDPFEDWGTTSTTAGGHLTTNPAPFDSLTYTPNPLSYAGTDQATLYDWIGDPITISIVVAASVPGAPTIGSATAGNAQATVSFTAPSSNGGSAITGYTVTSSPGGITATGSASPITVTGLTNGTAYTFTVTATNASGTGAASAASNSVTPKATQTITFNNPGAQNFGTSPTLTASATSGLLVSFTSSTTGVCTITSGGTLTFVSAGSCSINANQAGNGTYAAATTVIQSFTVNAIVPGAPTIGSATAGNAQATVSFTAPSSNGGSAITSYTVTSSPGGITATGSASPITVTGLTNGTAYTFTVTATNATGTGAASAASNSVTPKATQTITFNNPGAKNFGTSPTLTATATSGLAVAFSSSTTGVCTITSGGTLIFVSTGTCTINADQAGNGSYLAASTVSQSFTVNAIVPGAPTIGSATAGNAQATVAFTAPSSNGGSAITGYTVTSSPGGFTATGTTSPITVTGLTDGTAYTFTVTATNATGTGSASAASNSVTPVATQTITFAYPGPQSFGTSPTLTATATSGLTVAFSSSTTGVCTITAGGALTFVTTGTCTINADQAGNGTYTAAPTVSRSFAINAVVPGAPTIGSATAGNAQATVSFTAPAFTGGAAITSYTVTSSPGGITGTGATGPITVTGLTDGTAYNFTVTATNSAGTGFASAASNSVTPKAAQTITFANPGAQNFGTSPTLSATATSSLTVTFTSSTTGVCTITSGGALTFVSTGTCTIDADQVGNGSYTAASPVSQSFAINAVVPGAPTIGSATAGDAQATVSFTAPAFGGGAAITFYTVTSSPGGITATGATGPITVTGLTNGTAYTFTVTATNTAGTGAASAASNSATPAATQTITFANPGAQSFGTSPTLTATATSGLPVTFSSSTTGVCTVTSGGALTFVTTGTCTINADQAGNGSYTAAPTVSRPFAVNAVVPGAPTIGSATAGDTQAHVSFTAPAFAGGAAITGYTVTSSPGGITATGSASPVTVSGLTNGTAYTFTVTATNSAGTGAASAASNSITPAATQTITFANPGAQNFGTSPTLSATATSGLAVTFTSSTTGVCTVTSGGALTFASTGTCTINADQAGNGAYTAALTVTRSFAVNAVVPGAPTIGSATAGNTQAHVSFTAPAFAGGAAITGYTVTSSPGGITATGASSPVTVSGLTNGTAYTFTVTAANSAGTGAASAASNSITPAATQTITFASPGAQNFGTSPTLSASATSGLAVTFTSSTTGVCTVTSGGALTFASTGTCTISADQAGNGAYTAALTVTRSFAVNAVVPGAPTIGSATAGDAQASVSFTAPAFTGGAAITSYTVTSSPGGVTASGATSPIAVTGLTDGTAYNFTVTATNTAGTGAASAATSAVTPRPTLVITTTSLTSATVGTTYSQTIAANGGVTPYSFTVTAGSLPAGLSLGSSGVLSGTPTAGGSFSFTVQAKDAQNTIATQALSLTVGNATLVLSPTTLPSGKSGTSYSQSLSASGGTTPYSFSLVSGSLPAGLGLSGGAISGTPTATGTFSFTIKVQDSSTGSGPYSATQSYSLVIGSAVPILVADSASTPANQPVTIPVTANDTGPIASIAVVTKPTHGSAAVTSDLKVVYTPSANFSGSDSFTYTASNPSGTSAPASVSLTVTPLPSPTVGPLSVATAPGTQVSIMATAKAHGDPFTAVSIASTPAHGTATVSGLQLLYTPATGFTGTDSFTYTVSNAFGTSEPATATITVNNSGTASSGETASVSTPAQTPATVTLNNIVPAGSYQSAVLIGLSPANSGTVSITEIGSRSGSLEAPVTHTFAELFGVKSAFADTLSGHDFALTFTPAPGFAGVARISLAMIDSSGNAVAAGLLVSVAAARPDPSTDPTVAGLLAAQADAAKRFVENQITNVEHRLEQLHDHAAPFFSNQLHVAFGSQPAERRDRTDPMSDDARASDNARVLAGPDAGKPSRPPGTKNDESWSDQFERPSNLAFWTGGGVDFARLNSSAGRLGNTHTTVGVTLGADYRLMQSAAVGIALGYNHETADIGTNGSRNVSSGFNAILYGTVSPFKKAYLDVVAGGGTLDFDSRRALSSSTDLAQGHRGGQQFFGSTTGTYEWCNDTLKLSSYGRLEVSSSTLNRFAETSGGFYALSYSNQSMTVVSSALGLRGSYSVPVEYGVFEPRGRIEYNHDFQGTSYSALSYISDPATIYRVATTPFDQNRIMVGVGTALRLPDVTLSVDYEATTGNQTAIDHALRLELLTHF